MTHTETSLLAAVLRDPAEDAPRLVYADWLDEHGYTRRAEFIRLQIRIAEIERGCSCGACVKLRGGGQCTNGPCGVTKERDEQPDGTSKNAMLRLRESDLLDFGFDEIPKDTKLTYRRGFVDSVSLSLRSFMGGECERCRGDGTRDLSHIEGGGWAECHHCHGTGRVEGLAGVIGRKWPVTEISIVDREPAEWSEESGENRYVFTKRDNDLIEAPCDLPLELFNRLQNGDLNRGIWAKRFPTSAAALAALSSAAVSYMRERAGLPAMRRAK